MLDKVLSFIGWIGVLVTVTGYAAQFLGASWGVPVRNTGILLMAIDAGNRIIKRWLAE